MNVLPRPGRTVAAVGAVVAVSATTLMALVAGTAGAQEPGRCVDNVNVRESPSENARIVTVCEAGTAVQVGETRNGFVELIDLGGWSAQQFVSVAGEPPAEPEDRSSVPGGPGSDPETPPRRVTPPQDGPDSDPETPPRRVSPPQDDPVDDSERPEFGEPNPGSRPGPAEDGPADEPPADEADEPPAGGTEEPPAEGGGSLIPGLL